MSVFGLRHRLFFAVVIVSALFVSFPLRANAQSQVYVVVTAASVNLRAGPSLDANEVGAAHAGDQFPVLGRAHGSNRVWYKIQLPSGGSAWISERVVNVFPSADSVPWLSDNPTKIPLIMDCGAIPPVLFVGTYAEVTRQAGLVIYKDAGIGKDQTGFASVHEVVKVVDGPFCTRLAKDYYRIQWLVLTGSGLQGYMAEGEPDGKGGYTAYTEITQTTSSSTKDPSGRPAEVTDDAIQTVMAIFQDVQTEKIDEQEAQSQLDQFVKDNSAAVLAWIVRRVPIYDGKTNAWESFARYEDQTIMEFKLTSQLDTDPVSTTIEILFGEYKDNDSVLLDIGCGG